MKKFNVWIYDSESGCDQPVLFECRNVAEARKFGNQYIRVWHLVDGTITKIEEVTA